MAVEGPPDAVKILNRRGDVVEVRADRILAAKIFPA
jgi:hypothetical protein